MAVRKRAQIKDNIGLLNYCLQKQEQLADPHFSNMNPFIITQNKDEKNPLIDAYNKLNERIVSYKVALDDNNKRAQREHLRAILSFLEFDNINYAEFPSFWTALDSTYSMYLSMSSSEKETFVIQALALYIEKRYDAYRNHGTSPAILQITCDSYAYKRNASYASSKVI